MKLLKGQEAASLGPLKKQREAQKQKLLNSLREQLGPGAETSSAGIQALTQFDAETSNILGGAQQSALGDLLGGSRQTRGGIDIGGEVGRLSSIAGGSAQRRGAGLASAFAGTVQTAGSRFTGDAVRAQQQIGIGGDLLKIGSAVGGALAGNPSGAASLAAAESDSFVEGIALGQRR